MQRTPRLLLALLVLMPVVAACGGAPAAAPAPTGLHTAVVAAQAPTMVPTTAPTVAPTAAPTSAPTLAPTSAPTVAPTALPTASQPDTVRDPLSGSPALVRGALTARPWVVMIDNHPDAYPQTGLGGAPLVFEALAEFGVTRYMAVYAPGISPELNEIGPVRSARLYFVLWAMGLRGTYVHAGGSPEGINMAVNAIEILDLDALTGRASRFFRRSADRVAPHNLYTDSAQLAAAAELDPQPEGLAEIGYLFKEEAPADQRPASQSLRYFFLYPEDPAGWDYDPDTNSYLRVRRGRPHTDRRSGQQLQFKNVVVIQVIEAPIPGDEKGRIDQQVIGSGPGLLFQDGTVQQITWQKDAGFAPLVFKDQQGNEVRFTLGSIWVAAVPSLDNVTIR